MHCLLGLRHKRPAKKPGVMLFGSEFISRPTEFTSFSLNSLRTRYNVDASETFLPNLLHYCYTTPVEDLSPRRLALLLMVLSIGSLVDLNKPLGNLHGEAYHHLARAAVCEIPLMEEPDFDVLHTLVGKPICVEYDLMRKIQFFMIWYHLIFSDNKKAVGYAWNLMGFVAKLAQGVRISTLPHFSCYLSVRLTAWTSCVTNISGHVPCIQKDTIRS